MWNIHFYVFGKWMIYSLLVMMPMMNIHYFIMDVLFN